MIEIVLGLVILIGSVLCMSGRVCRRQEVITVSKEDIEKQKKLLTKKKPPKNIDFVKPGDRP